MVVLSSRKNEPPGADGDCKIFIQISAEFLWGSARVSRAGFGVAPKQSFLWNPFAAVEWKCTGKVRDREDALANTRDAYALHPQISPQRTK
ncbi:MAG: hypothetical protein DMF00_13830 [Verrucomicrobia bacterium]|nr:MAG: hypothetical protein DMF00_13830 [Verrucomicrobiota bacterium]